ncbi:MAG: iron-sulfur cluster assembly accessory protein [Burkholderiales bacterium]
MASLYVRFGNDPHHAAVKLPLFERKSLLDLLLTGGVALAHECGGKIACATCRVIVREGLEHFAPAGDDELDMLDTAGIAEPNARLACQAIALGGDLVIEIPPIETAPVAALAPAAALPVLLTPRAARHLAAQLAKRPASAAVRLGVAPAGCSGLRYRVEFADAIRDDDVVFESDGIRIAVEPASLPHVQGTTLDLVQEGLARRLRFDNPNARSTCGCGESFGT